MSFHKILAIGVVAAALVGCGGGDININADNNSTITDTSTYSNQTSVAETADIVCASYTDGNGVTKSGQVDGDNCVYSESFVDFDNPLMSSLTIPDIGKGAHIFAGSLFVGKDYSTLAAAETAGITKGGDGPTLTIREGVTIALQAKEDFVLINRGSRIVAQGTKSAPITFTSETDLRGLVSPEEVQSWGGMIINGFSITNSCDYVAGWAGSTIAGNTGELELATNAECSILQEGAEGARSNHYGGTYPNDNSGTLSYVVVKHAGYEVLEGNELNGITFGAVGSGTTLNNIQIYSNQDDGVEFFGGTVDLTNFVALYVRDDSIDIDQGYRGTITNALVIQGGGLDNTGAGSKTGAHCVESDGSGGSLKAQNITNGYISAATINNLTCIISAKAPGVAGNSDPGAGVNAEEGHNLTLNNAIVTTAYALDATKDKDGQDIAAAKLPYTNYCFQLEDTEDKENAGNGLIKINDSIFACADISAAKSRDGDFNIVAGTAYNTALTGKAFLEAQDNQIKVTNADGTDSPDGTNGSTVKILDGFYSLPTADMQIDGAAVTVDVAAGTTLGAVTKANDWTAGWTYGLHADNRGQALWFE